MSVYRDNGSPGKTKGVRYRIELNNYESLFQELASISLNLKQDNYILEECHKMKGTNGRVYLANFRCPDFEKRFK